MKELCDSTQFGGVFRAIVYKGPNSKGFVGYRLRYLDGWQEKETRAAMAFGRCFEQALNGLFCGEDPGARLFDEWNAYRETPVVYRKGESWDRLLHQGIHFLQQFAQQDRARIRDPLKNLQLKVSRALDGGHGFVSYLDAVRTLDGLRALSIGKPRRVAIPTL